MDHLPLRLPSSVDFLPCQPPPRGLHHQLPNIQPRLQRGRDTFWLHQLRHLLHLLVVARLVTAFWPPSHLALRSGLPLQSTNWVDLGKQQNPGLAELGWPAVGPELPQTAEFLRQTDLRRCLTRTGTGVSCVLPDSRARGFLDLQPLSSGPWTGFRAVTQSATPLPHRWKPESTLQQQKQLSLRLNRRDGCGKWKNRRGSLRAGDELPGACFGFPRRGAFRWNCFSTRFDSAKAVGRSSHCSASGLLHCRDVSSWARRGRRRSAGPVNSFTTSSRRSRQLGGSASSNAFGRRYSSSDPHRREFGSVGNAQAICRSRAGSQHRPFACFQSSPNSSSTTCSRIGGSSLAVGSRPILRRQMCILLSSGGRSGAHDTTFRSCAKSQGQGKSHSSWYYRRRREKTKTYCGFPCIQSGSDQPGASRSCVAGPSFDKESKRSGDTRPSSVPSLSLATATWRLDFGWISWCLGSRSDEGDAAPKKFTGEDSCKEQCCCELCQATGRGVGDGERTDRCFSVCLDHGRARAVKGSFEPCRTDCIRGTPGRHQQSIDRLLLEGCSWQTEASGRASYAKGHLLPGGLLIDGQTNAACPECRSDTSRIGSPRNHSNHLCRALWGLRQVSRLGADNVADSGHHGPPPSRELRCGKGCGRSDDGDARASLPGRREAGCGTFAFTSRRPSSEHLHQPHGGHILQAESLCTSGQSKMGSQCSHLHQGVGHHPEPESGCHPTAKQSKPTRSEGQSKATAKEISKGEKLATKRSARRRGAVKSLEHADQQMPASALHKASMTVPRFLAALPRWILATRTQFASFLASTFFIQRWGSTPASVVFPLPFADFDIFASSGPKLSRRRWKCLLRKRARHIVIAALNFIHGGVTQKDVSLLGRCPNQMQRLVHKRLWALIATCDSPEIEELSMVPGRSGTEFIARLQELEEFIAKSGLLEASGYHEGSEDLELKKVGVAHLKEESLPVKPYRQLDSSRLKLVGQGRWKLDEHLDDELWLPYVEPKILHHQQPLDFSVGPNLRKEDRDENFLLAKKWENLSLLTLVREPPHQGAFTRIFNAYKSDEHDRQIGDRRLANATERHLQGPSKFLPIGYMMTGIHVPPGYLVRGAITDRKDFYHQAAATRERAATNVLPFAFLESDFADSRALEELLALETKPHRREDVGDNFRSNQRSILAGPPSEVYPAFRSLLQGDHLGVEFALSAHGHLLEEASLLCEDGRIQGGHPFPRGPLYEGLVIDDYFALSIEPCSQAAASSPALRCFDKAIGAYEAEGVIGSPEKDIKGSSYFKVVGAEINSSPGARSRGVITVSAPVQKRISLAVLSLRLARLPVISAGLASKLAGNWTSILLYRRCLTCLLSRIYDYGARADAHQKEVYEFSRSAAQELVLCSVLGLVAAADVSAGFLDRLFATDASLAKGAVVSRQITKEISKTIWLGGDRRGSNTKLDSAFRQAARAVGLDAEDLEEQAEGVGLSPPSTPEFSFDFVEVCGGKAETSKFLSDWGYSVMPPIELSDSRRFDLTDIKLYTWLCNMLKSKRLRSIMLEPVCTSFSPAAHPSVRSYAVPKGFCRTCPKTLLGNIIAFRCIALAWYASLCGAPSLLEQPRLSKMCWLSCWRFLLACKGFSEAVVASCQFGSIHRKEFRLLLWGIPASELDRRCPGGHSHVPIQGAYTKPSAVYVSELARFFAQAFDRALRRKRHREEDEPKVEGIQSAVANDLLLSGDWQLEFQWHWQHSSHINLLESHAFLALLRRLALRGGDSRFVALLDSRVAKGSHARGRSSAKALMPSLKKSAAIQVAYGLYPSLGFAPTKLNVADDPTRDQPIRETTSTSFAEKLPQRKVAKIHAVGLSQLAAKWVRITVLLLLPAVPKASALEAIRSYGFVFCSALSFFSNLLGFCFAFGFILLAALFAVGLFWSSIKLIQPSRFSGLFLTSWMLLGLKVNAYHVLQPLPLALCIPLGHGVWIQPETADEQGKASRRASVQLQADRVLRPQTRSRRDILLADFGSWLLHTHHMSLADTVDSRDVDPEHISNLLVEYGKQLYYAGKPYGRYSETINAVGARRPMLRKALVSAWDLAFCWVSDEPAAHHPAMPLSVVLSFATLATLWGWPQEAALFLLMWCGILRVGEMLNALRADLILPQDSVPGIGYTLLQIRQPKTRGSAARHQSARIDPVDVTRLLTAVFGKRPREEHLWRQSPSTLRKRFGILQKALGLPTTPVDGFRPYDLASMRPGGATFLLQRFEDAELVRRRGRWLSSRVLEIYLQEVAVATFANRIPDRVYDRLRRLSSAFPTVLDRAIFMLESHIPPASWPHLW